MGFVDRPDGWTLFYGRLDGRSELAATLGVRDDSATPDLELVRLAIDRWEEKAPQRLLGDFAVAAWRNYSQRLILAADVSGLATGSPLRRTCARCWRIRPSLLP
jgi:asparagine synthase (glutamine-hydrolysing)